MPVCLPLCECWLHLAVKSFVVLIRYLPQKHLHNSGKLKHVAINLHYTWKYRFNVHN